MSALARDAASFRTQLQRQDFSSWHSNPQYTAQQADAQAQAEAKKKKAKPNVVYSQPADTGTGTNINTQLVYAVDHLKSTGNPMRLQDIAIMTNTPLETDMVLLERFKAHDRVQYDPKTGLYSYRHEYQFRNKAALLTEIQRHTRRGGGMPVRVLKDSWKEAPQAIEELEKDGEVYVTRTTKDQQMRMVFWNEIKPQEDTGGAPLEQEFRDLWHSLKVPTEADILRALASEGLQATNAEVLAPKAVTKKKGKKSGPRQRQVRITNVHLKGEVDLSKDYVAPAAGK